MPSTLESPPILKTGTVLSRDGTPIGHQSIGQGPALLVLHGGMRASVHYQKLAEHLSGHFTVHLMDRRGRLQSGPHRKDHSVDTELEDIEAMLKFTGATRVFGHSGGGAFALEAALRFSIEQLALFEPAVNIENAIDLRHFPRFTAALEQQKHPLAMAIFLKHIVPLSPSLSRLPLFLSTLLTRAFFVGPEAELTRELLYTIEREVAALQKLWEGPEPFQERYRHIHARTLFMLGGRGARFLHKPIRRLGNLIPNAVLQEFPDLDHNAPDLSAAKQVADALLAFFKGTPEGK